MPATESRKFSSEAPAGTLLGLAVPSAVPAGTLLGVAPARSPVQETPESTLQSPLPLVAPAVVSPFEATVSVPAPPKLAPELTSPGISSTMPTPPKSPGWGSTFVYTWQTLRALAARVRRERHIHAIVHKKQTELDDHLYSIGKTVHDNKIDLPFMAEELRRMADEKSRQVAADEHLVDVQKQLSEEKTRWADQKRVADRELEALEAALVDRESRAKHEGAHIKKADSELKALQSRLEKTEYKSLQAEKTGASAEAVNLRAEVQSLSLRFEQKRGELESARRPFEELVRSEQETRETLRERKKNRREAEKVHLAMIKQLEGKITSADRQQKDAVSELSQRFVAAGTLLHLQRVNHAALTPIYEQIDEVRSVLATSESELTQLQNQRQNYDRSLLIRGGLQIVAIFAFAAIVTLAILLFRSC